MIKSLIRIGFLFCLILTGVYGTGLAANDAPPASWQTYVLANPHNTVQPMVVVEVQIASGHYVYAPVMDAAKPTLLQATSGGVQLETLYPPSTEQADVFDPTKRTAAYTERFMLFVPLPETWKKDAAITMNLSMLVCSPLRCTPVEQVLTVSVPPEPWNTLESVAHAARLKPSAVLEAFAKAQPAPAEVLELFGESNETTANTPDRTRGASADSTNTSPAADSANLFPALEPRFAFQGLEPEALGSALLLGVLAGIILNLMPCVLPVLTIKITSLLSAAGHGSEASRRAHFREHNLLFAAGILTWFVGLAVAVGGLQSAWGGLFQHAGVVYGLMLLVFLLGLSLFDVFTLPVLDLRLSGGSSRMQAYLAGIMVTLLATPCSGPLLGGVLGWAALQPVSVVLVVFVATGTGMALPYLILAGFPSSVRWLPKPGAWTGILERLAGFFLMATALYLFSLLPQSMRMGALVVLLIASVCAWVWGQWAGLAASRLRRVGVGLACIAVLCGGVWLNFQPASTHTVWSPFNMASFNRDLGKTPMLVEFTADWCPTCKALERFTLTPERMTSLQQRYGLHLVRVDLTRPHAEAEALLRALGSVSLPVTAIFPAGDSALTPLVLRDVFTPTQLERAVREALE